MKTVIRATNVRIGIGDDEYDASYLVGEFDEEAGHVDMNILRPGPMQWSVTWTLNPAAFQRVLDFFLASEASRWPVEVVKRQIYLHCPTAPAWWVYVVLAAVLLVLTAVIGGVA